MAGRAVHDSRTHKGFCHRIQYRKLRSGSGPVYFRWIPDAAAADLAPAWDLAHDSELLEQRLARRKMNFSSPDFFTAPGSSFIDTHRATVFDRLTSDLACVYNSRDAIHFKRSGESHATEGKRNMEGRT